MQATSNRRTLRPAGVAAKLGIGLSTVWFKAKHDPDFPKFFKLSPRTTVLFEDELNAYLVAKAAESRTL